MSRDPVRRQKVMQQGKERVRELAYQYWEYEGRPEGRAVEHWLMAEAAVEADRTNQWRAKPVRRSGRPSAPAI